MTTQILLGPQSPVPNLRQAIEIIKPDAPVVSDRGQAYQVSQRGGVSTLTSQGHFSLTQHLFTIEGLGCRHLTAELAHLGPFSPLGKKTLEAVLAGSLLEQTSAFNFEHEME